MNLSNCVTNLELKVYEDKKHQVVYVKPYKAKEFTKASKKLFEDVAHFYKTILEYLDKTEDIGFDLYIEHSFPHKAGIASSSSFYSGLALAFVSAFGKKLNEKELSILARLSGSGSAARSIPDGFVIWNKGNVDDDEGISNSSFAESLQKEDYWEIADVVVISSSEEKKVGSQEGHKEADSSPFFADRLLSVTDRINRINKALEKKDFASFGKVIEEDAISMHTVMMTQKNPLFYWSGKTLDILRAVIALREKGTEAYYTIDAGQNVHVICLKKDVDKVADFFKMKKDFVDDVIINYPAKGARLIE
jgi:diphosphomevalonate decarboxylase